MIDLYAIQFFAIPPLFYADKKNQQQGSERRNYSRNERNGFESLNRHDDWLSTTHVSTTEFITWVN